MLRTKRTKHLKGRASSFARPNIVLGFYSSAENQRNARGMQFCIYRTEWCVSIVEFHEYCTMPILIAVAIKKENHAKSAALHRE